VDSGYREGQDVPVYYDPMLAKVIVFAETRAMAVERAIAALREFVVLGIKTNIPFLLAVLDSPRFRAGTVDTRFLDVEGDAIRAAMQQEEFPLAALAAAAVHQENATALTRNSGNGGAAAAAALEPFVALGAWRG
jgi:acetyl/propionyl-CoA carboxylase alpha subunit